VRHCCAFIEISRAFTTYTIFNFLTGATDGIGKSYAFSLAKRGLSIVLVSRTESKLQDLQKELQEKFPKVVVKYVVVDYSNFDEAARKHLLKETKDLDIGVLVNNVGMSYRYPRYFHELPDEEIISLNELNIASTTWMTKMYVEDMAKRGRGTIVNMSSIAGLHTQPLLAQYGAGKSYVEKFSKSINVEYKSRGVTCQVHVPCFVATKMSKMRKSFTVPDPDEYVEMSMKFIGQPDDIVQAFWLHAAMASLFTTIFPEESLTQYYLNTALKFRKKGLKKDEMIAKGIKPEKTAAKRADPILESLMFWRKDLTGSTKKD
jgi:17beta-estradiol 17-dehydrogenase / very-long-chain 3-oxoacyl-CoA reductase